MPKIIIGEQEFEISDSLSQVLVERLRTLKSPETTNAEEFFATSRKRDRSHSGDESESSQKSFKPGTQSDNDGDTSSQLSSKTERILSQYEAYFPKEPRVSGQSAASGPQSISASVVKDVLMRFEIEQGSIRIITNKQRPTTSLAGSSQGDHVTAYAALLQMICSVMDGEDVHGAPEMLYEAATCFIDEREFSFEPDNIPFKQKQQQVEQQFFPRDLRKRLTSSIRTILNNRTGISQITDSELNRALQLFSTQLDPMVVKFTNEDVERLRDAIKRSNQTLFAQFAVTVGEQLIRSYNKQPTVVFPKLNLGNDPNEGNRVKMAMRDLKLLDKLIGLVEEVNKTDDHGKQQELLEDFRSSCEYIMRSVSPKIVDETIDTNLGKLLNTLNLIDNGIFSLKDMNIDTVQAIQGKLKVINTAKVGELFNDLFDFKCSKVQETTDPEEHGKKVLQKIALTAPLDCLYQVTARHEDLMFIAFKNLAFLPVQTQQAIVGSFHDKVIAEEALSKNVHHGQGWGKWVGQELFDGSSLEYKDMTKEILDAGVSSHRKIHHSTGAKVRLS